MLGFSLERRFVRWWTAEVAAVVVVVVVKDLGFETCGFGAAKLRRLVGWCDIFLGRV